MNFLFATAVCLVALAAPEPPPGASVRSAADTVKAFYQFHLHRSREFTEAALREREKWLTPELAGLLRYELRREIPKDEPPFIEGDPFTDSQEGPASFRVLSAVESGRTAAVNLEFLWKEGARVVDRRRNTIRLVKTGRAWGLADIQGASGAGLVRELQELKRRDAARKKAFIERSWARTL